MAQIAAESSFPDDGKSESPSLSSNSASTPTPLLHPDFFTPPSQYNVAWKPRLQWYTFGDSITQQGWDQGWVSFLAGYYQRKADIINRGYSGYNTNHAIQLLQQHIKLGLWHLETKNQTVITIFFGANDAVFEGEFQHVSLDDYTRNLETLITTFRHLYQQHKAPTPIIIIIAPPPVDGDAWARDCVRRRGMEYKLTRSNERTGTYASAAVSVASKCDLSVINTWSEFQSRAPNGNWSQYLIDGLHLTKSGNQLLFKLIVDCIAREHKHLLPAGLPFDAPTWDQFKDGCFDVQPEQQSSIVQQSS